MCIRLKKNLKTIQKFIGLKWLNLYGFKLLTCCQLYTKIKKCFKKSMRTPTKHATIIQTQ